MNPGLRLNALGESNYSQRPLLPAYPLLQVIGSSRRGAVEASEQPATTKEAIASTRRTTGRRDIAAISTGFFFGVFLGGSNS